MALALEGIGWGTTEHWMRIRADARLSGASTGHPRGHPIPFGCGFAHGFGGAVVTVGTWSTLSRARRRSPPDRNRRTIRVYPRRWPRPSPPVMLTHITKRAQAPIRKQQNVRYVIGGPRPPTVQQPIDNPQRSPGSDTHRELSRRIRALAKGRGAVSINGMVGSQHLVANQGQDPLHQSILEFIEIVITPVDEGILTNVKLKGLYLVLTARPYSVYTVPHC